MFKYQRVFALIKCLSVIYNSPDYFLSTWGVIQNFPKIQFSLDDFLATCGTNDPSTGNSLKIPVSIYPNDFLAKPLVIFKWALYLI